MLTPNTHRMNNTIILKQIAESYNPQETIKIIQHNYSRASGRRIALLLSVV